MQYVTIPVTAFEQNCSIVWCKSTNQCALIDPGGDTAKLIHAIKKYQLTPTAIWLTHGHLDHVGGTPTLATFYSIPVYGPHEADLYWLEGLPIQARQFGLPECDVFTPTKWLKHGDVLKLGNLTFEVLHTPGHTPGHVVIYQREAATVFAGDVIFNGAVGRTDFPGGNQAQLMHSIKTHLWALNDNVTIVAGHGPETTIGEEKRHNQMVR